MNFVEICNRYYNGERFNFNFFWGGYLSNWFESNFIVDGVSYWCVEQYMMAKKAELFKDTEVLAKIMKSNDQREVKGLGRKVKNFDESLWDANKECIVFEGNYAKFAQNDKLKTYLINQKDKVLVEASPYDKIWGIGLDKNVGSMLEDPRNWQGTNLLGFILMGVRDKIISEME